MEKDHVCKNFTNFYNPIYFSKDYQAESKKVLSLIRRFKKTEGNDLLDVGCGSGRHLIHLKKRFSCMGIDINEGVLNTAKMNVSGVKFQRANMITFKTNKKFDVITCLFSAIGYVKTKENLRRTIKNFYKHLNPGGIVIIEPWLTKDKFKQLPHMSTYDGKEMKIARVNVGRIEGNISILDFHFLIAEKSKPVKYFVDRHELGLFEIKDTLRIMRDSGFDARFLNMSLSRPRGVYICIK